MIEFVFSFALFCMAIHLINGTLFQDYLNEIKVTKTLIKTNYDNCQDNLNDTKHDSQETCL